MADFLICSTGVTTPEWVKTEAAELGITFASLTALTPDNVAKEVASLRPKGYLLCSPDYGPFVSGELADAAAGLEIVTYMGQSPEPSFYTDNIDLGALHQRDILVTTMPDTGAHPVAECAMAFLFALELDLVPANDARKAGCPYPTPHRRKGLFGSTLGIVGMGNIGRRVAEMAHACGMHITYYSRTRRHDIERQLGATFLDLPTLFSHADYVSLHLPSGDGIGLIDAEVLSHARGIGLINTTSLAKIIDAEAMLMALEKGWVGKVAIEGTYAEPYDSLLRKFGNKRVLLMPPYTSYSTPYSDTAGWRSYLNSLSALVKGEPVPHQIRSQ